MKTITHFDKPDLTVKNVLVWQHGTYPKNNVMHKDAELPMRMFPNARFTIRCKPTDETIQYFMDHYKGFNVKIVNQEDESIFKRIESNEFDAIFSQCYLFLTYRKELDKPLIEFQRMLFTSRVNTYIFYNEEVLPSFVVITDYVKHKFKSEGIKIVDENPYLAKSFKNVDKNRKDFSNWKLLLNEDRVMDHSHTTYKEHVDTFNFEICYLSDVILYDLPKRETINIKQSTTKNGVYIGAYFAGRVALIKKYFDENTDISFKFIGIGSHHLQKRWHNEFTGNHFPNSDVRKKLMEHDYSTYFGKGRQSRYLGATFYEPLLAGIPVFIWIDTDKDKQIFPNLDCYFRTESELNELVKNTNLSELCKQQIDIIYKI